MDSSFDQIILYSILILRILWLFQLSSAISIISWFSHPRENLMEILIRLLYFQKKMRIFGSSSSSIRLWLISILIYRMAGCSSCPPQFLSFHAFLRSFPFPLFFLVAREKNKDRQISLHNCLEFSFLINIFCPCCCFWRIASFWHSWAGSHSY